MKTRVEVREYASVNQSLVADLILSIQQDEYGIPITLEDQPDLLEIENFYRRGKGNFWTALNGERVVGTIALLDIGDGRAALRKMFVAEDFRGGGLGVSRQLLQSAISWAAERGISEIWLGTTPAFKAAHRFYEKNGFAEVPRGELPERFPVMEVDKKFYRLALG
ncbi:GNAT family N-acetyltransferase [Saccharibacillus sp. CPCC 101409]|uniref:GNAT family N-acetyltransferase n=1 Tax=Saccharibacillus sp. CPCC 101409 TaxID=3058041 RepID=UPI00267147CF|nr:GNAT family N-acetyltransferase [Saccharibacillus sp. CPCC 101409]MDO3411985.1 GNAT family N-acetyltransferase [Saccharibacillus sp. CPCC 101409]